MQCLIRRLGSNSRPCVAFPPRIRLCCGRMPASCSCFWPRRSRYVPGTGKTPREYVASLLQRGDNDELSHSADAAACYSTCIALSPQSAWAYFHRGLAQLRQQNYTLAASDFDHAISLRPSMVEAYID